MSTTNAFVETDVVNDADLLRIPTPNDGPNDVYFPVARFAYVLDMANNENRLTVDQCQRIGLLFSEGGKSTARYMGGRLKKLREIAEGKGANFKRDVPEDIVRKFAQFSDGLKVEYNFVPLISFPRFMFEFDNFSIVFRESLTVCGAPSRSKVWLNAHFIRVAGKSMSEAPCTLQEYEQARMALEPIRVGIMEDFTNEFYPSVLTKDAKVVDVNLRDESSGPLVKKVASSEVVGFMSNLVQAQPIFAQLESMGVSGFIARHQQQSEGDAHDVERVHNFIDWARTRAPFPREREIPDWEPPRYKMVDLYREDTFDVSQALVVSKARPLDESGELWHTWYGALGPVGRLPDNGYKNSEETYHLSQVASGVLATEYGRFW